MYTALYIYSVLSLSLVCMKVRDCDVLAWVQGQKKRVKYWAHLGYWISPCYGLFLLGTRFETHEPFISLILQFYWGPQ
jgi:hypothetical protein